MSKKRIESERSDEMSFLDHLEELRWHIVRASIAIMILAVVAFIAKHVVFDLILFAPKSPDFATYRFFCWMGNSLGLDDSLCLEEMPFVLQNISLSGQFATHIWVSLIAGFIGAFPYVVYEIWRFIAPGLHPSERKSSRRILGWSSILFFSGVLFGYYLITPLSIQFLGNYTISDQVLNEINLQSFISTVTTVTLVNGLVFELPIIIYFLARVGLVTPEWMTTYRKHAFVVILILSAIITPPDVSSQLLVTLPLFGLYQISIGIARRVVKQSQNLKA